MSNKPGVIKGFAGHSRANAGNAQEFDTDAATRLMDMLSNADKALLLLMRELAVMMQQKAQNEFSRHLPFMGNATGPVAEKLNRFYTKVYEPL